MGFFGYRYYQSISNSKSDFHLSCRNIIDPPQIQVIFRKDILDTQVKNFILSNNLLSASEYKNLSDEAVSTRDNVINANFSVKANPPTSTDVQRLSQIIIALIGDKKVKSITLTTIGLSQEITSKNLSEALKYLNPSDINKFIVIAADDINELIPSLSKNYPDLFHLSDKQFLTDFPYNLGSDKAIFTYIGNKNNFPLAISELKNEKIYSIVQNPLSGKVIIFFLADSVMKDSQLRSILTRYSQIDSASLEIKTKGVTNYISIISSAKDAESFASNLGKNTIVQGASVIRCLEPPTIVD